MRGRLLVAWCVAVVCAGYVVLVSVPMRIQLPIDHAGIVGRTAPTPTRHYALMAWVVEAVAIQTPWPDATVLVLHTAFSWAGFGALLAGVFVLVGGGRRGETAVLLTTVCVQVSLITHWTPVAYSPVEAGLVVWAWVLLARGRWWPVVPVVPLLALAALNRPTGALLVGGLMAVYAYRDCGGWPLLRRWAVVGLVGGAAVGFVRLVQGNPPRPERYELAALVAWNLDNALFVGVMLALFFGGPLLLARWRGAPELVRVTWPVWATYAGFVLVYGLLAEVRMFVPLVPVLVLAGVGPPGAGEAGDDSTRGRADARPFDLPEEAT